MSNENKYPQFDPADYHEGAKPLDPEKVQKLYFLENGMTVAGVTPKSGLKKTQGGNGLRVLYPMQLQSVNLPGQGQRVIFVPIIGCESFVEIRNMGITATTPISDNYKRSYLHAATVEYLLTTEAINRLGEEARARAEEAKAAELAGIESERPLT